MPPISSTTISMSGSFRTTLASVVSIPAGTLRPRSVVMSLSAMRLSFTSKPVLLFIMLLFSRRILAVPEPTVPKPIIPTDTSRLLMIYHSLCAPVERLLYALCRLLYPVFVFNKREPHEVVSALPEADAGGYRNLRLFNEEFRKFERSHIFKRLRYFGPYEHSGLRRFYIPAGLAQSLDESVPSRLVNLLHILDTI